MGVSSSSVVILSLAQKCNPRLLQIPDALQFPPPSALALSPDEEVVVVGHTDGALGFYETKSGKLIKFSREVHKSQILVVKFYNLDGKHIKESRLITSDAGFKTCKVIFKKGIFSYDIDYFQLIPESRSVLQVEVVESMIGKEEGGGGRGGGEKGGEGGGKGGEEGGGEEGGGGGGGEGKGENLRGRVISLASERDVMIIEIEPKARRIISFPPPPEGGLPSISWNNGFGMREEDRERKSEEGGKRNEEQGKKEADEKKQDNELLRKEGQEKEDEDVHEKKEGKKEKEEKEDENKKEEEKEEEAEEDEENKDEEEEEEENTEDDDKEGKEQSRSGLYLMIGWGFHIYIVKVYIAGQRVDAKLMGVFKVHSKLIYVSFLTENLCLFLFEGKAQIVNIYDLPEFQEINVEDLEKDEFFLKKVGSNHFFSNSILLEEEKKEEAMKSKEEKPYEPEGEREEPQFNQESKEESECKEQKIGVGIIQEEEEEFPERKVIEEKDMIDFRFNLYYSLMVKEAKTSLVANCYNLSLNRRFTEKALYFMYEKVCISRLTVLSWESYMSKVASTLPWQDTLNLLLQIYQGLV